MSLKYILNPELQRRDLIIKYTKKGIVLDLGSQEGDLHIFLKANIKNSKIIGVDFIKNENVDIIHDLNKKFPFKNNYADTIIAGEIIEHLINPFEFLKECNRVLKKGGILILTTPNMTSLSYILKIQSFGKKLTIYDRKDPHLYGFSMEMLEILLKKSGFKILNKKYLNIGWRRNVLFRLICFLFKNIRPTLFFAAKKV
ncbi:MAG: methyltransferase domain-containing protein [Candidatus Aenigmarchaeota archaeon]|nr:methyltransferase domain-containing protein [Candidatus Aenigmarchaeota archaeon]MBU5689138.1 methyltransferase domain-containing protein [Candidatus Aenigmarchaeota archaeon]